MPVTENLRKGMRAARAGRKAEATSAFQSALKDDPTNETALLWLGYLADDPQVSLDYITKAIESHVQSPRAYAALQWAWRRAAASSTGTATVRVAPTPTPVSRPVPTRHRKEPTQTLAGLPAAGIVLLLVALIGGMICLPLLAQPPVMAALASASTRIPQSTATADMPPSETILPSAVPISPSPTATSPPASSAMDDLTPDPTETSLPTLTPTSTSSPVPTPSPTAAPVGFVVPEPFPIPGPHEYVPSTTLLIPTPVQPVPVASDAVNIVVLGSDRREDWSEWHTDVVQIVSVRRSSGTVSVISIPRDLYVYIPSLWMSRINFADFYGEAYDYEGGGRALLRDTLLYNLGIRMDHCVRTNFDGLIGIVDTVGGVDIPVHCHLSDHWPYADENGEYPILTVEPGVHHMDGETALWYARSRLTTSVFSRERRQQQVLLALWHKGRDAGMLMRVPDIWEQGQAMIETDLTITEILDLAHIALTLDERNVQFYNIGQNAVIPWTTPYGGAVFLPNWEEIQPIVAEAMAPPSEARLVRTYLPVEVWNGTPNEGWGWLAADRLYRAGFSAVVNEADRRDYAQTQLIIFNESIKGSGAGYLQSMFGLSDDQLAHQPGESSTAGFRIILGADYQTCPYP